MFSLEEKVENYLKEHGITKIFLANLLNISAPNLAAMFSGKRKMKSIELIIFARHFGLDIDFFSDVSGLGDAQMSYAQANGDGWNVDEYSKFS